MTDHFEQTIAEMQKKLKEQETEVIKTKDMINRLCEYAGKPIIYADNELETSTAIHSIQSDQFYGQPLAKSVRQILEMRKISDTGPATVKEIYEALMQGSYHFDTKNEQNAMRGLRISLTKNALVFHKLPNGRFGLVSWYPNIKKTRNKTNNQEDVSEITETLDTDEIDELVEDEDGTTEND